MRAAMPCCSAMPSESRAPQRPELSSRTFSARALSLYPRGVMEPAFCASASAFSRTLVWEGPAG